MTESPIHQIINLLNNSLKELGYKVVESEVERIGILIFLAMEGERRKFHNSKHVLDICYQMTPLQTLAGLFHDVIYYQIDKDFPPQTAELLLEFVNVKNESIFITDAFFEIEVDENSMIVFEICLTIFGFKRGQKLEIHGGQNEFLSALVGALLLANHLTIKQLITVIICIEATIPFRKADENGQTPYHKAEKNLEILAKEYDFLLTEIEKNEIIRQAVGLANRDVANFAAQDVGKFLDGTWTLLPESHAHLWYGGVYTVTNYRIALSRMEGFFSILQPDVIFDQHNNFPDSITYNNLIAQARKNIAIGYEYIGVKLLPIAIIEAAAMLTGGDAPLSFFMGDVRIYGLENAKRVEDFLPEITENHKDITPEVYHLLEFGRTTATSFDLQNSPLASFIYKKIGALACKNSLVLAKLFFKQEILPYNFLQQLDRSITIPILRACSNLAETRKQKLLAIINMSAIL
jgi:hypothetical protein